MSRGVDLKAHPQHVLNVMEASLIEEDLRVYFQTSAICSAVCGDAKGATAALEKLSTLIFPEKSDPAELIDDKTKRELDNIENWKLKLDLTEAKRYLRRENSL